MKKNLKKNGIEFEKFGGCWVARYNEYKETGGTMERAEFNLLVILYNRAAAYDKAREVVAEMLKERHD